MQKIINCYECKDIKAIPFNDVVPQDAVLVRDLFVDSSCIYFGYTVSDLDNESVANEMFEKEPCIGYAIYGDGTYIAIL